MSESSTPHGARAQAAAVITRLPCQRHLFDIPEDIAYLNCAYMSPLLRRVTEAGQRAVARKAHPWDITPADFFSDVAVARRRFAQLLGGGTGEDDIAIVPAVSYGMAVACANLPLARGQTVLLLDEEFPSVILPWRERAREAGARAVLLPRPADDDWTSVILEAIDERTAIAALPALHWTDGALIDLPRVAARLHDVGAALAVDATQSLGAMPFPMSEVRPDFLVAASYKWLLGPYSLGFLYVAPQRQNGRPIEHNWITRVGSQDFTALTNYAGELGFQPGARRFDVGETPNFALMPMAIAALDQILEWGVPHIAETIASLTGSLVARAAEHGLEAVPAVRRAPHYVGLRFPAGVPPELAQRLAAERVFVSVRGRGALRVTPHVYNTEAEIDRLVAAIAAASSSTGSDVL
ncbi:MAG TPA: aminotransferase class V-fold PLP-dependent enzyme [Gemmatimonadales bacterium]|jgi:selenocysteine lyase/cysteine desulfurase|nr:aminotransferase class V-fold PLP-dependent enzyme [Gemmatimonadales bacterium]